MKILAINAGSSSLKFKLFEMDNEAVIAAGNFEKIGFPEGQITIQTSGRKYLAKENIKDHPAAVKRLFFLMQHLKIVDDFNEIAGVGHRVVAGGEIFDRAVIVTERELHLINQLAGYAPLHNPANLMGIKAFKKFLPHAVSVAVFDTSFHQTIPPTNFIYSVPYEWYQKFGVRRYGAHGTSHRYVTAKAADLLEKPLESLKLISCHLGAGASVCAVKAGKSFDTSMGFTPLTGLTMATRAGDTDISMVSFMMQQLKMHSMPEVIYDLNKKSGLLGISGISADMREILAAVKAGNLRCQLAIKIFVKDVVKYIGAYAAEMNGFDGLIFTAGIGENAAEIRKLICERISFLGADLDLNLNQQPLKDRIISKTSSKIKIMIIQTNEELMIAREVINLMKQRKSAW